MANGERGAPGTGRLLGMDGLRGVAALAILITHVWDFGTPDPLHTANGGGRIDVGLLHPAFAVLGLAVPLFFTLSGFLLYRSFSAAIIGVSKQPSVRDYARACIFRIVPTYWVILSIVGVVFGARSYLPQTEGSPSATSPRIRMPWHRASSSPRTICRRPTSPASDPPGRSSAKRSSTSCSRLLCLPLILLAMRAGSQRIRIALAFVAPFALARHRACLQTIRAGPARTASRWRVGCRLGQRLPAQLLLPGRPLRGGDAGCSDLGAPRARHARTSRGGCERWG